MFIRLKSLHYQVKRSRVAYLHCVPPSVRTSPIHPIRGFSHLVAPEPLLRFVTDTASCRRSHRVLSITAVGHCFYAAHTRRDEIA